MARRKAGKDRGGIRWVIDTSSIVEGGPGGEYPMKTFVKLWTEIEGMFTTGSMVSSIEVLNELERKDDDLLKWARGYRPRFLETDEDVQNVVRRIVNAQPNLLHADGTRGMADPFVVALARVCNAGVVTQEKPRSVSKPRIPEACQAEGVLCVRLAQLAVREGWKI